MGGLLPAQIHGTPASRHLFSDGDGFAWALFGPRPRRAHGKTVLVVDADLGFVLWLGQVLRVAGYAAFPALSVPGAVALLAECKLAVDILIVDASLCGASGFVAALQHDRENIKVVSVSEGANGSRLEADTACEKPAETSEACLLEWATMMRRMLFELSVSASVLLPRRR